MNQQIVNRTTLVKLPYLKVIEYCVCVQRTRESLNWIASKQLYVVQIKNNRDYMKTGRVQGLN